jgi:acid phosphatase type 7
MAPSTILAAAVAIAASTASASASASASPDIPTSFRIAPAGPTGMRVTWTTNNASSTGPLCVYGTSPSSMNFTSATGVTKKYIDGGYGVHSTALLTGLLPGTSYSYSCGDGTTMGRTWSFTTAPTSTTANASVSLAIFGDWGYLDSVQRPMVLPTGGLQRNFSATLTRELLETLRVTGQIDGVWNVGDIAYQDDGFGHDPIAFEYEPVMSGWQAWVENLTATMPYLVSPGNHESECHSPVCILSLETIGLPLSNFSAYNARWAMPSAESGGVENMWYSTDLAGVHIVSINTETDFDGAPEANAGDSGFAFLPAGHFAPDGAYMAWLERDLAAAAANPNVHWIIAGGHRPVEDFNSSAVTSLFAKYGVAMYFAGHAHSYARYQNFSYEDGAVHITVGGAGCDEMPYPSNQLDDDAARLAGTGKEACEAWCSRPEVRASFAGHGVEASAQTPRTGGDDVLLALNPANDPCRYCASNPVYVSALMAIGVLDATPTTLSWRLLRAPDGLVLDSVTISK